MSKGVKKVNFSILRYFYHFRNIYRTVISLNITKEHKGITRLFIDYE